MIFNSPHNPSGHVATEAELQLISKLCIQHDALAVSDEVHSAAPRARTPSSPGNRPVVRAGHGCGTFLTVAPRATMQVYECVTFGGRVHHRLADQPGMAERTVTIGSASKMFSLTGWRVGWLTGCAVRSNWAL